MVTLENPLCAGTKRFDPRRSAGGGRREEQGRTIFQPFDFHFLIAAATEAVGQLRIEDWKFIALFPELSIAEESSTFLSLGGGQKPRAVNGTTDRQYASEVNWKAD